MALTSSRPCDALSGPAQRRPSGDLRPIDPGAPGSIVVNTRLEDLAGNNLEHLFDIDTFHPVTAHLSTQTISVPFTVR
ncbi:MAG TPA: hypothetical protein VFY39_15485 [Gammaproteobacteria bacterium]|nr:hypothetical protein [Gammaproteobacteria bacterium]